DGQWVQIVSLIRWSGLFFPQPEFGGVQLIRQHERSAASFLWKMLFGTGEWIPPDEVPKHRFLVGQHVLSYSVSRYMARSFRFQNGFLAPFPGYHEGDIRIPDMPEDVNDQPFTVSFRMPGGGQQALPLLRPRAVRSAEAGAQHEPLHPGGRQWTRLCLPTPSACRHAHRCERDRHQGDGEPQAVRLDAEPSGRASPV